MPDLASLTVYLSAAFVLAITPGPGIFYVLARSLKGGRAEGYASSFGTGVGGLFHVVIGALGLSAILASSAVAFSIVKFAGAAYLIYLGIRVFTERVDEAHLHVSSTTGRFAFRQGIVTEMLNPKTALFFLAFIPQFINPDGVIFAQFILLGCISVFMNTTVDLVVATFAGPIGYQLKTRRRLQQGQRIFTGSSLVALGIYLALADGGQQGS